jgi:hypothetical protein
MDLEQSDGGAGVPCSRERSWPTRGRRRSTSSRRRRPSCVLAFCRLFERLTERNGLGVGPAISHGDDCEVEMSGGHALHRLDDMGGTADTTRGDNRGRSPLDAEGDVAPWHADKRRHRSAARPPGERQFAVPGSRIIHYLLAGTRLFAALPLEPTFRGACGRERDVPALRRGDGRGSVATEERQDGQHAPVAFSSLRDAQLREDAADVLLDRPLGQPQAVGDADVGQALGHQREHFTLPW